MSIQNIKKFLKKEFSQSNLESKDMIIPYGILGVCGFIIFYFLNYNISDTENYENSALRMIAASLSLLMALRRYWPEKLKNHLFVLWNFTLVFNIPFFFTFMVLKNIGNSVWPLHWVLALTLLMILINLIPFLILSFIGVGLAIICYVISTTSPELPAGLGGLFAAYTSFALYYIFIFQRRRALQREKIKSLSLLAGTVAHEMRTPLLAIGATGKGLEKVMPSLITSYKYAIQENVPDLEPISSHQLHYLSDSLQKMKKATDDAFLTIDMLLMNLKENPQNDNIEVCSINQCIKDALEKYSLDDREEKMVHWQEGPDFQFRGTPLFLHHVFLNLLKNALFYVKKAGKGAIFISTASEKNYNIVYFKDTGPGIDSESLDHIFDQFYTKTAHGTGIGLAFCKKVMEDLGGDISCSSVVGEFTEFKLRLPKKEAASP